MRLIALTSLLLLPTVASAETHNMRQLGLAIHDWGPLDSERSVNTILVTDGDEATGQAELPTLTLGGIGIQFDGRFLRADDLKRDQDYLLAGGDLVGAELTLLQDDKVVGVYHDVEGVLLSGEVERSGVEIRKGFDGQIEIATWSIGSTNTATFQDGSVVRFTGLELTVPIGDLTADQIDSLGELAYETEGRIVTEWLVHIDR